MFLLVYHKTLCLKGENPPAPGGSGGAAATAPLPGFTPCPGRSSVILMLSKNAKGAFFANIPTDPALCFPDGLSPGRPGGGRGGAMDGSRLPRAELVEGTAYIPLRDLLDAWGSGHLGPTRAARRGALLPGLGRQLGQVEGYLDLGAPAPGTLFVPLLCTQHSAAPCHLERRDAHHHRHPRHLQRGRPVGSAAYQRREPGGAPAGTDRGGEVVSTGWPIRTSRTPSTA